ncbi:RNA polymerase sigma factor [Oscillibacter hominis]|uniref:RNA polymerase sigma factor n=1 Tax=Oscillibacter hominis TaxID=2763056 RepID=A0A7G9B381_9FIRM|nr:RNA polymerase sigma factor [Oscillibacter hominis]QNL44012.1 RNA polymerase sigma factor [Oscillibacter hominis]
MEDYISDALKGDHRAFSYLYDQFAPAALRLSAAITRRQDLAEDAVQEAFLRAYRKGHQCTDPDRFRPWFFRIVINESRRILRKNLGVTALDADFPTPSFAEGSDRSLAIAEALDRLSPEHRSVLVLRFLLDLSEREISEILKKPVGTVKSRIHYAKEALAQQLKEEERHDRS